VVDLHLHSESFRFPQTADCCLEPGTDPLKPRPEQYTLRHFAPAEKKIHILREETSEQKKKKWARVKVMEASSRWREE